MESVSFKAYLQDNLSQKYSYDIEGDELEFALSDKAHEGAPLRIIESQDHEDVTILAGNSKSTFDFGIKDSQEREAALAFIDSILAGGVVERRRLLFSSTTIGDKTNYDLDLTSWGDIKYSSYPSSKN